MKRLFTLIFILIALILTALTAFAQNALTQTYVSPDGTVIFRYPDGWDLDEEDGNGYIYLVATDLLDSRESEIYVDFTFILPDVFERDFVFFKAPGQSSFEAAIEPYEGDESMPVATFTLQNRQAAFIPFYREGDVVEGMFVIEFSDGRAGGVFIYVIGDFQEIEQTLFDILISFDYAPPGAASTRRSTATVTRTPAFPTGTPGFSSNPTLPPPPLFATATITPTPAFPSPTVVFGQGGSGEVCSVSVSQARTATVRSGPSAIRPAVLFLPENRNFTVTGSSTAADGTVWYRLDKQEVAPDKSAKEVWVSAAQVTTSSNC